MPFPFNIIDLTHPISMEMPVWPGDTPTVLEQVAQRKTDGYNLNRLKIGEHSGTHIGVARHFFDEGKDVASLGPQRLIVPGVKMACPTDADHLLTLHEISEWESRHGKVPASHAVLIQTGWDRFWKDEKAYWNRDKEGGMHFPGLAIDAAHYLVISCGIRVIGIDTPGLDGGKSKNYAANIVLARSGGIHIENMTGLRQLPEKGFYLILGALPIQGGTGAPGRILGLVPK
jgi:kynurenine formamidase